jgi:hypothetical protein
MRRLRRKGRDAPALSPPAPPTIRRHGVLSGCLAHSAPLQWLAGSLRLPPVALRSWGLDPRPWLRRARDASPPTVCACVRSGWSRGCLRVSCRDALRRPVRRWSSRKSCRPRAQPPGPATMSLGDGALGVCAITGIIMARLKLGTLDGDPLSPSWQSPPVCQATFRNRLEASKCRCFKFSETTNAAGSAASASRRSSRTRNNCDPGTVPTKEAYVAFGEPV